MAIQVVLEDHTGNVRQEAKLSDTAPVQRLIPAIVTALKLPITDPAGRAITYHLSHDNRRLQQDETLESAGVRSGDQLTIVPEMTAGADFSQGISASDQALIIMTTPLQERQPVQGFPASYYDESSSGSLRVRINMDVMQQIWVQTKGQSGREAGGILAGKVYQDRARFLVDIERAFEARYTKAGSTFLTFTGQTWTDLLKQRQRLNDTMVVGWYHSHPGLGIFLSASDIFIQRAFFGHPAWHVALVVDPVNDSWGVFALENGEVTRCLNTTIH